MAIDVRAVLVGIVMGIGATLVMDLWNLFLKRTFKIQSLNYCLLGRWLGHMPFECTVGWIAHYSIGVTLALVFVVLVSAEWLARPTLLPVLSYGLGTVVFPFFVLQPSLGLGVASSRAPNPAQARLKSLTTHSVFGVGLYVSGLAVRYIVR